MRLVTPRSPEGTLPMQQPFVPSPLGGVFEVDPNSPPPAPHGARAFKVKDDTGRLVGWAWVVGERAGPVPQRAYEWLEETAPTPASPLVLLP